MELPLIKAMQPYLNPNQRAPGDDCALLAAGSSDQLVTTDMLMDGVHFLAEQQPLEQIGYKAMGVNISDIAAMAGSPHHAFVSLAIPKAMARDEAIDQLYKGMHRCTEAFGVTIEGGDTNIWAGPLVIAVTVLGSAHPRGAVLRSSAKAGDQIMVTGPLGGSLHSGRHLNVQPRIVEAKYLADHYGIRGMADISDGLGTDLRRIMTLSGLGVLLEGEAIPVHADVAACTTDAWQQRVAALTDGEDFELVFCCEPGVAEAIGKDPQLGCTAIGSFTSDHCQLRIRWEGFIQEFNLEGYLHR